MDKPLVEICIILHLKDSFPMYIVTSENSRPQKQTWAGGLHFFKAPPLGTVFPRLVGC